MNTDTREWERIMPERGRDPYSSYTCPICGLEMTWNERNGAKHKRFHNHILDIEDKYELCLGTAAREELKQAAYDMATKATDIKEKKLAFLIEWYSRFMRSLIAYPDINKHPSFEDYISMILYRNTFTEGELENSYYGSDVIDSLINDFGTLKGIPGGSYFLDDYSRVAGAPFTNYLNGREYIRNGIPNEYKEPSIRLWVKEWSNSVKDFTECLQTAPSSCH